MSGLRNKAIRDETRKFGYPSVRLKSPAEEVWYGGEMANKDGCSELDMYTTDLASDARHARRMVRPGGTPRAGPAFFTVPAPEPREGQGGAETEEPRSGPLPLRFSV